MAHVKRPGDNCPDWQIEYWLLLRPNQAPLVFRDEEEAEYFTRFFYSYLGEPPEFTLMQVKHTYEDLCSLSSSSIVPRGYGKVQTMRDMFTSPGPGDNIVWKTEVQGEFLPEGGASD